jgi:hypothetical protein
MFFTVSEGKKMRHGIDSRLRARFWKNYRPTVCALGTIKSIPVLHLLKKLEDCIINFRKLSFFHDGSHLLITDCLAFPPQSNIASSTPKS